MLEDSVTIKRLQWISGKLPNLAIKHWKVDDSGWDNFVIIVNYTWIFRFPRTLKVQKRLLLEKQLLDQIKEPLNEMNLEVPIYQLLFDFVDELPVCCFYKMVKGTPLSRNLVQNLSPSELRRITNTLGDALALIHSFGLTQFDFKNLLEEHTETHWRSHWSDIQLKVLPLLTKLEQEKVIYIFETFLEDCKIINFPKTLIHGDLSHSHIIYSEERQQITGIIDFGDAKIGDPAYDFSGLYSEYGNDFMLHVLERYHCHKQLKYDTFDLYRRVVAFYGKRPIFYDVLHELEKKSPSLLNQQLDVLRRSLH